MFDQQNKQYWNLMAAGFVTPCVRVGMILLTVCISIAGNAQRTITGQIVSTEDGRVIQDVNIFVPGSTLGTSTDPNGAFRLEIPDQVNSLFITHVAYESRIATLTKENDYVWQLTPQLTELKEVSLESSDDSDWKSQFRKFRNAFIGTSFHAVKCNIDNYWTLEFENESGILRAYAASPLVITNGALGYRITFLLEHFFARGLTVSYGGHFHFEELKGTGKEAKKWKRNRKEVYKGSMKHFLHALANDQLPREGFVVHYAVRNPGTGDFNISRLADYDELVVGDPPVLNYRGILRVLYTPSGDQKQISYLEITGDVRLNTEGYYPSSEHLREFGYWNTLRMAELLPNDYLPEQ